MGGADELRITQLGCIMPAQSLFLSKLAHSPRRTQRSRFGCRPQVVICFAASTLQIPRKCLAKLLHLRPHHKRAVPRVGVLGKVVLVVGLGRAVVRERLHLGGDGRAKQLVLRHLADHGVGDLAVLGVVVVDAAAVLRAHVVALAVEGGRVVGVEEDFQNFFQADFVGVEREAHHLGVAGVALADLLVAGVDGVAVGVAAFHVGDAAHAVEHGFGAPETTTP